MIIHKVLDNVFATWSNIAVLRVISKVRIGLSGREIAKQSGMSAPSCLESLSSLENLNIVTRQRGGREHFFFLNREHYIVNKIIIPILNAENKKAFIQLERIIAHKTSVSYSGDVYNKKDIDSLWKNFERFKSWAELLIKT